MSKEEKTRHEKFDQEKLLRSLTEVMEKEHLYQNVDLTIEKLSDKMGTNRTYLSRTINEKFQIPFRQWLNNYRIERSIQYMLTHPSANQVEIAQESGFLSASSFNHKFKSVIGTSPRLWLIEQALGNKYNEEV